MEAITGHQGCETAKFCWSCNSCQLFGPRKPSQTALPILQSARNGLPQPNLSRTRVQKSVHPSHGGLLSSACWARAVKAKPGAEAVRAITDLSRTFAKPAEMPQFYHLISLRKGSNRPFAQRDLDGNSVWLSARNIQMVRTACAAM